MKYQLIALDLDDTLLTSEKVISENNQKIISQAMKAGTKIVLCSGRTHNAVVKFAKVLGITGSDQYMITNGGAIIENLDGKIIYQKMMSNKFYREFVDFVKLNKLHYNVVDKTGNTYTSNSELLDRYTIKQAFENDNGLYLKEPDQLPDNFEIVKAIINGNEKELDNITNMVHKRFDKDYFVVRTGVGFLEIFPKDVNKGTAIKFLAQYLGLNMEQTMAMGDRDNDLPMLEVAGMAIAMGNAVDNLKKHSDFVTSDNDHDGVGVAINKFVLNK